MDPFWEPSGRTLRICLYFGSYLAPCQPGVLKRGPRSGWPRRAGFGRFGDPRFGGWSVYSHLTHSSGQEGPNMTLLASQGPYRPNRPNTGQIQAKSAYLGPYGRIWPQMAPEAISGPEAWICPFGHGYALLGHLGANMAKRAKSGGTPPNHPDSAPASTI